MIRTLNGFVRLVLPAVGAGLLIILGAGWLARQSFAQGYRWGGMFFTIFALFYAFLVVLVLVPEVRALLENLRVIRRNREALKRYTPSLGEEGT